MTYRYRYGAWDGSQEPFDLHADEVMDEISNDLFNDGSVARALNRLMQRGMKRRDGQQRTMGVRDMMERLKQRRQQQLDKYDMGSVLDGIKEKLEDIVKTEREGIDKRMDEARKRAAQQPEQGKALQTMQNLANKRRDTLDQLPEEPAGQIKELSQYDFMDPEARRKFEELMEQLKQRMMEQYFKDMQQAMKGITPEQMQAMKDMLKDLSQMMQQ
ncbi:MAG: VWA domain-containing protein, partial [Chloroflexi bacterium]|nr:VWA domain-containing protein [Chloroflexota bacterium]